MKLRKIAFGFSGALSLLGIVALVQIFLGNANMGVDFSGGSLLQYKAGQDFSMNEVRAAFDKSHIEGIDLQKVENEGRLMVKIKKSSQDHYLQISASRLPRFWQPIFPTKNSHWKASLK